jgi:hypothetical protein
VKKEEPEEEWEGDWDDRRDSKAREDRDAERRDERKEDRRDEKDRRRDDKRDDRRDRGKDRDTDDDKRDSRRRDDKKEKDERSEDRRDYRREEKRDRDDKRERGSKRKDEGYVMIKYLRLTILRSPPAPSAKKARTDNASSLPSLPPPIFPLAEARRFKFDSSLHVALMHPVDPSLVLGTHLTLVVLIFTVGYGKAASKEGGRETKLILFNTALGKVLYEYTFLTKEPLTKLAWSFAGTHFGTLFFYSLPSPPLAVSFDEAPYISVFQLKNNQILAADGWTKDVLGFSESVTELMWCDMQYVLFKSKKRT